MILQKVSANTIVCAAVALAFSVGYSIAVSNTSYSLLLIALAIGGFVTIASFLSPQFGFYALLFLAMFSRFELPIGGASLRLDQLVLVPVLAGIVPRLVATALNWRSRSAPRAPLSTVSVVVFVGLALYIAANALSSLLFAPQPTQSFKIVVWLLLSFAVFAVTYFVVGKYVSVCKALFLVLAAGFFSAALGIFFFLLFLLTGSTFGVQQISELQASGTFQVYGTFFEANIFGSFQAFSATIGIAVLQLRQVRGRAFWWVAIGTTLSIVALALSSTRAAWLAFLVGMLILFLFQFRGGRFFTLLSRLGVLAFATLLALVPTGLLESLANRFVSIADLTGGTFGFRLARFETALYEWPSSPVLGLGTNSFGQRHLDPSQNYAPDYLGGLFVATLYDVGLVGLLILLTVFGVIVRALFRVAARGGKEESALALALLCGVISLLISYQVTNAFWFSYNWIIIAIVLRLYQSWWEARKAPAARAYKAAYR